jgi:hypothetical protein
MAGKTVQSRKQALELQLQEKQRALERTERLASRMEELDALSDHEEDTVVVPVAAAGFRELLNRRAGVIIETR